MGWIFTATLMLFILAGSTLTSASAQRSYYTGRSVDRSFVVCEYAFSRDECVRNAFLARGNDDGDDVVDNNRTTIKSFGTLGRFGSIGERDGEDEDHAARWCSTGTSGVTFSSKTKEYVTSSRMESNATSQDVVFFDAKSRAREAKAFSVEFWITPRLIKLAGFTGRHYTPFFTLETPKKNETFNPYAWTSPYDCSDEFDFALYIGTDFSVGFRSREPITISSSLMAETCASVITKSNALVEDAVNHFVLTASFSDEENALGENRISCYANGTKIVDEVIGDVLVNSAGRKKFPFASAWRETSAPYFGSASANNNEYDSSGDNWEWTNTIHAFAMYDKKMSDEEITRNYYAGLPNAAPLVVDVDVTINEDVKEAKIVLQYTDDDYYNATMVSSSGSSAINDTISSVKYSFSILTLPGVGVLKAIPIEATNSDGDNKNNGGDGGNNSMQTTEAIAIPVTHVPFRCFGNAVFYTPEPNDHSKINDTLEIYANFTFKVIETSLLNEFETIDSPNEGLVSVFVSPVNNAPLGVFQVVEYFGREEGKAFQIEFRDADERASKIEVSQIPSIGKVFVSKASSSVENTKALNVGDIVDVTSEGATLTYRLDTDDGDRVNVVPSFSTDKKYLTDSFAYYVYDIYDEKAINETKVEFRVQSPVRPMPPSSFSTVKETTENAPLEFTIDILRLDCQENATEAIAESLPTNGTVYLIHPPVITSSSIVSEEERRKTPLKENDVVRLEHTYRTSIQEEREGLDGTEQCVAFAKLLFVPDDFYFNAPNVDIFGDPVSTTRYASLHPLRPFFSASVRDILDGWMVESVLNVSFIVAANIPHAPAKFQNVTVETSASDLPLSPSYLLRVDSNETHVNDSSSTLLLPNGGYLKFRKAFEYDLSPDYDAAFGVAVTIKSINPRNDAFLANLSLAFPPEREDAVKSNISSIVVTKWLRNQIKIAGPPIAVRDILFNYVLYDAKTMKKTPRVVSDTLELTLEYGFVKLYNAKKVNETINAKYDWKHDSCRNHQPPTGTTATTIKPCTRIAHVNIEAIAYPTSYDSLIEAASPKASNAISQKSLFISGLFQGAVAGLLLLALWKYFIKNVLRAIERLFCCLFCCRLRPPPSASERRRQRRRRRRARKEETGEEEEEEEEEEKDYHSDSAVIVAMPR
jgi:hypothetical protein